MARRPRRIRANAVYCCTQRTVDRAFLFKPERAIRQIVGSSAGRAQRMFPVKIYWLDFNINHKQTGKAALSDSPEHIENLVKFDQLCNSLIARGINDYIDRPPPPCGLWRDVGPSISKVEDLAEAFWRRRTRPVPLRIAW